MAFSAGALKGDKSMLLACEWGQIEVWSRPPADDHFPKLELHGKVPTNSLEPVEQELLEAFWPGPLFLRPRLEASQRSERVGGLYLCCPYDPKLRKAVLDWNGRLYARSVSHQLARFTPTLLSRRDGWWSVEQSGFVSTSDLRMVLTDPVVLSGGVDQARWSARMSCYWLMGSCQAVAHRIKKALDQIDVGHCRLILSTECGQALKDIVATDSLPRLELVAPEANYADCLRQRLPIFVADARNEGVRTLFVQAPNDCPCLNPEFETVRVGAPENSI